MRLCCLQACAAAHQQTRCGAAVSAAGGASRRPRRCPHGQHALVQPEQVLGKWTRAKGDGAFGRRKQMIQER